MPRSFIWPIILLLGILGYTVNDLRFAISDLKPLTEETLRHIGDLSYTQHYRMESPLRFRVDIANPDKSKSAAILWPQEPFTRILILADDGGESLNTQRVFTGQLVRCIYRCLPSGMLIEMDDFIQMLETRFPAYKEQPKLMPTMVLNTLAQPIGFQGYLKQFSWHYGFWVVILFATIVWEIFKRLRPDKDVRKKISKNS